jgi:hypothetical protein
MSSYKFRILLDTADGKEIFRDIQISAADNFETFYRSIIESFEFSGQELASFYVSNENWDKGHEIALMDMQIGENLNAPSTMAETILEDIVNSDDQKFILVYDFLRMWCFLIELIETNEEATSSPILDLSVGEAPDETSREMDFSTDMGSGQSMGLGNDFDDIFSESSSDDDEFESFENIDDLDI